MNNGLYEIKDPCSGNNAFNFAKITVRCDMETDGGGWIVIQRRITNGIVNFTRNWEDYVNGFGDLDGEFWIGLNNIYQLTNQQEVELQISVWNNEILKTSNYQTFRISDSTDKYRLSVSGGTGDGYYTFQRHNRHQFSTYDNDNDGHYRYNCAYRYQGGWWYIYSSCTSGNLNGRHERSGLLGTNTNGQLLTWENRVYTNSIMMIRSKTCARQGHTSCR